MEDSRLFKIAFLCGLIGTFVIFIISEKQSLEDSDISRILTLPFDSKTSAKGRATKVNELPGVLIFSLEDDTGKIKVIAFKNENITLEENSIVKVQGILKEYGDEKEIEADLIKMF